MSGREKRSERFPQEDEDRKWWYSIKTDTVEYGPGSPNKDRLGPYPDRASAEAALSTAKARNDAWDKDDEKWEEW
ncbi:hypothetical protein [Actinorugispora endophytica]|uniref:Sporulation related protein n=1 Tax=Actinorugispora endophytica TaxID=1605990 RepID=A0A4R6V2U9_9ACTN|nr:hypothetical protein [Actinorugispora endophytica]TDQ52457.1 hypothetical protein EV190_10695 [Actinorugispora endophytica]